MSIKISYLNKSTKKSSGNLVLFVDEKFNISELKNLYPTKIFLILKT